MVSSLSCKITSRVAHLIFKHFKFTKSHIALLFFTQHACFNGFDPGIGKDVTRTQKHKNKPTTVHSSSHPSGGDPSGIWTCRGCSSGPEGVWATIVGPHASVAKSNRISAQRYPSDVSSMALSHPGSLLSGVTKMAVCSASPAASFTQIRPVSNMSKRRVPEQRKAPMKHT